MWLAVSGSDYFTSDTVYNPFVHTWSLGVEEQFYLVIPAIYSLLHKLDRRRAIGNKSRVLPTVLMLVGFASFILCVLSTRQGQFSVGPFVIRYRDVAFYSAPTRAWEFLAGFLIAGTALHLRAKVVAVLQAAAILVLLTCFLLYSDSMQFPGWIAVAPVGATVVLLLAGTANGGQCWILSSPLATVIGDHSYGLYLWHWPALILFSFALHGHTAAVPLALLSTVALAVLSRAFLEVPLLKPSAKRTAGGSARLALFCIGVPIVLFGGVVIASPRLMAAAAVAIPPDREYAGFRRHECVDRHDDWARESCSWGADGSGSVFLVGDSHAWALADVVGSSALQAGYAFKEWTHLGCPFSKASALDEPGCSQWQAAALQTILDDRPELVVIANRSPFYAGAPGEVHEVLLPELPRAESEEEALVVWDRGLRAVVDPLVGAGIPVLLVSTVPEFNENGRDQISFIHPNEGSSPTSISDVAFRRGRVEAVEGAIAESIPMVQVFDPAPYLCVPLCRQFDGHNWLYYDDDHLTLIGAAPLQKPLRDALEKAITTNS